MWVFVGAAPKNRDRIIASAESQAVATDATASKGTIVRDRDDVSWPGFMPAFLDKGRQRALVQRIPVRLVLQEDIGQRGARCVSQPFEQAFSNIVIHKS